MAYDAWSDNCHYDPDMAKWLNKPSPKKLAQRRAYRRNMALLIGLYFAAAAFGFGLSAVVDRLVLTNWPL